MKKLNKIKKLLESNYNFKGSNYKYFPKTNKELKQLVDGLIKQYGDNINLNNIDVSNIEDFSEIFIRIDYFNGDVSEWNVINGVTFNNMFSDCNKFAGDISNWDVSNSINFDSMFFSML